MPELRPYIYLKYAMSLDGKMATATGDSQWITGSDARMEAHRLRNRVDAILIGSGTLRRDNPRLTTRLEGEPAKHPLRIVLCTQGPLDPEAKLWSSQLPGQTMVACTNRLDLQSRNLLARKAIPLIELSSGEGERVALPGLMAHLLQMGIRSLMVEGGSTLLTSFFRQGLFDEVWSFIAPRLLGGAQAPTPFDGDGFALVKQGFHLKIEETRVLGGDLLIISRKPAVFPE